jgi:hypothetical protein
MENKEELINKIREWVKIDNEIRFLQKSLIEKKKEKKDISLLLISTMKKNEIDCFDINDGKICYAKKCIKKPISKKILIETLSKYFKGDIDKANELNNLINENRSQETKESIVRKIKKTTDLH